MTGVSEEGLKALRYLLKNPNAPVDEIRVVAGVKPGVLADLRLAELVDYAHLPGGGSVYALTPSGEEAARG